MEQPTTAIAQLKSLEELRKENKLFGIDWKNVDRSWLMEEIVFNFICLEDDIIEDLCRDVPADSHYERYAIAHSVNYERKRWSQLQKPRNVTLWTGKDYEHKNMAENKEEHPKNTAVIPDIKSNGITGVSSLKEPTNDALQCLDDAKQPKKSTNGLNLKCQPLRKLFCCDKDQTTSIDISEPVKANNEICPKDENCNDLKGAVVDDGIFDKKKLDELYKSESHTARIKVRLPKSDFDANGHEEIRKFLIDRISKQINAGESIHDGEMLMLEL
eukprot:Seg856.2 transcript_id=Seg856.2/GoldUCD/mRNA.D3Y31 product="hypothetical protein" protein_id=Seg856.2/GoldUCD/D3Y31